MSDRRTARRRSCSTRWTASSLAATQSVTVALPEALGDRDLVVGRSANLGELRDVLLALGVDG